MCNGNCKCKSKKRLEVELFRYGTLVFGRILHQDKDLWKNKDADDIIATMRVHGQEYKIRSVTRPQLTRRVLYIRGKEKESDDDVFSENFDSIAEAQNFCEAVNLLIDEINAEGKVEEDKPSPVERVI